jgi:hypothetical protein
VLANRPRHPHEYTGDCWRMTRQAAAIPTGSRPRDA